MQRESRALGMEPRNFFRLGKRRLDGVPELLEHRVILVIGPPWSSLVLSHLGPRSGPSWSCLVLVGLAPRSLALAGPWFVFLGFPWSSVLLVLGPLGPRSLDLSVLLGSLVFGPWSLLLVLGPRSSVLGPRSLVLVGPLGPLGPRSLSVLGPWSFLVLGPSRSLVLGPRFSLVVGIPPLLTRVARMRADALWEMKRRRDNLREQSRLLHPELLAPDWLSGPHPPPSRAWSHGPTDRSYGTIGRSRSNPPLLTRVARMRADALWEMKRRRDNLREQSRLLHPELLAPDWLSGPHPPLHGRGVTGPPIGPTGPSVGAAPIPHSSHEWRG